MHSRVVLPPVAFLTVVGAAIAARVYFGPLTTDDAYISLRYARNLIEGSGFVFNHGERVLGTTTPLFTLMLAAAASMRLSLETAAFVLPLLSDVTLVTALTVLSYRSAYAAAGAAAAAFIAVAPIYVTAATSGMETSVYVLLLAGALHSWSRSLTTGAVWTPAGWLAALIMCRADAVLALAAAGAVGMSVRPRQTVRLFAVTAALIGPWLVFAGWYFGNPIPQSVLAKAALAEPFAGVEVFARVFGHGVYVPLTILACLGGISLWRTASPLWRALLLWWGLYAATFIATGAFARFTWYFVPLMPAYIAAAAAGWGLVSARVPERASAVVLWLFPALIVVYGATRLPNQQEILAQGWLVREGNYLAAGRAIAGSSKPCNLAATEIGALGFSFPGRIIDLAGLITPIALSIEPEELLERENAAWFVTQNIFMSPRIRDSDWFRREFALVESYPIEAGRSMDTYARTSAACR